MEEYTGCSILALCVVFLIIVIRCNILRLLLCCFNSPSPNRNLVEGQYQDESIPYTTSLQLHMSDLELSIIVPSSLPASQFKKNGGEVPINTDCAICLGEFEEGEWIKLLPNCSHGFHVSCIDTWFQSHSKCPLCRSHVSTHSVQLSFHT